MASSTVIRAERISKRFEIDDDHHSDATLRDALAGVVGSWKDRAGALVGRESSGRAGRVFVLEALKDVTFSVDAGEAVGIVGRNGAGKSTLLKILSRITEPDGGRVGIKGRVGSLLEVGTGFHPELTGRENVFLYGSILGMPRAEIKRRFDDIVEFAEVGRQLDTPIKRYSSGMQVRLAFSVAAYLEPDILLVDEVLAVGDAAFQKRCLGRMGEVAGAGRTVLFVSHNMALVQALCTRGIVLDHGTVQFDGAINDAVAYYLRDLEEAMAIDLSDRTDRRGRQEIKVTRVEIAAGPDGGGVPATGAPLTFAFELSSCPLSTICRFKIHDEFGNAVAEFRSSVDSPDDRRATGESNRFVCTIDELPLVSGRYRMDVEVLSGNRLQDSIEGAARFEVEEGMYGRRPIDRSWRSGSVAIRHAWQTPTD